MTGAVQGHTGRVGRTVRRGPGRSSTRPGDTLWAWAFIGPAFLGLAIFYFWPLVRTFYFSFTSWGVFGGHSWTGLDNYRRLLGDHEVWHAVVISAIYTAISLVSIPIAAVIATMLNQENLRGKSIYRAVYFLPVVTLPAAIGIVWRVMYNSDYGPINAGLRALGIPAPNWLYDPSIAIISVGIVGVWMSLGMKIIILLAGLQSIPREIYEASEIDGASPVQRFRHVTMPLLTPTLFFVTVVTVIGSLQMFDLLYVMVDKNNPALQSNRTIVYLFYEVGFVDNNRGYAAAIAFLLLVIILLLTAIQFRLQKRWVHYD